MDISEFLVSTKPTAGTSPVKEMYLLEATDPVLNEAGYRFYLTGEKPFFITKEYAPEQINYFKAKGYQLMN
jgi:hypothetical protein